MNVNFIFIIVIKMISIHSSNILYCQATQQQNVVLYYHFRLSYNIILKTQNNQRLFYLSMLLTKLPLNDLHIYDKKYVMNRGTSFVVVRLWLSAMCFYVFCYVHTRRSIRSHSRVISIFDKKGFIFLDLYMSLQFLVYFIVVMFRSVKNRELIFNSQTL